jgi:hypothetical protein
MARSHDATGRSIKGWKSSRQTKRARPPEGSSWVWLTREMLESPAWCAMRLAARKVLDRLIIEHLAHAGLQNGALIVTYTNFQQFGVRRPSIAPAIVELETLGIIDVVRRGGSAYAEFRNPSIYALAWLDRKDGTPPTSRWKTFETEAAALEAVRRAVDGLRRNKAAALKCPGKNEKPDTKTYNAGYGSVADAGYGCVTSHNKTPDTETLLLSRVSQGGRAEGSRNADGPSPTPMLDEAHTNANASELGARGQGGDPHRDWKK